jgi:hypothetical protein
MMRRSAVWLAAALSVVGCTKDDFTGAQAEVQPKTIDPDLPQVPEFKLPERYPDGSFTVKELRVKGRDFLDDDIKITGYVVQIYSCADQLRAEGKDEKTIADLIENKMDQACAKKPQFRIADSADAGEDKSIRVVDVPRPWTKREKDIWKKREDFPGTDTDPQLKPAPKLALGDQVVVEGKWVQTGGAGDQNFNGLLSYGTMTNVTQSWPDECTTAPYEKPKKCPKKDG